MVFLLGSALIFGGLLGHRYRAVVLVVALPFAFFLPCGLAWFVNAGTLEALGWAFLASAGLQLGFLAGGLAATGPDGGLSVPSYSQLRRRDV